MLMSKTRRLGLACRALVMTSCLLMNERASGQQPHPAAHNLSGYWEVISGPQKAIGRAFEIRQAGDSILMDLENGIVLKGMLTGNKFNLRYKWTPESAASHVVSSEG